MAANATLDVLSREVDFFRSLCWAPNTQRAYAVHRRAYLQFCNMLGLPPVPATSNQLCMYAAYLARRMKYNSIKQYMNIIRILHLEWQLPSPLSGDFHLQSTLQGIRRHLGDTVSRKEPITPQLLLALLSHLDVTTPEGANTWAAALIMFFGLLRRSNVLSSNSSPFNPALHLRRQDLIFTSAGLQLRIRWSKTLQFKQKEFILPLCRIKRHPLCPTRAAYNAIQLTAGAPRNGPAFVVPHGDTYKPTTADRFVHIIKTSLSNHCDTSKISGHSFRRGGASWAYASGVPIDTIRQLGDWKSNAYMAYTICNTDSLHKACNAMASTLPT